MTPPDAAAREAALKAIEKRWASGRMGSLLEGPQEDVLALLAALRERDERMANIAFKVEHPELAHLHYDGCPYKPWADKRDDDLPDPRPECTCGEVAKGAYWKGQHLLERGYHELSRQQVTTLTARVEALEGELTGRDEAWRQLLTDFAGRCKVGRRGAKARELLDRAWDDAFDYLIKKLPALAPPAPALRK